MSDSAIDQLFSTMGSATTPEAASELLWQHYGLRGSASVLNSERDQNFHIRGDDGRQYVLKLTHPAEARGVTDFQTRALLHAARQLRRFAVHRSAEAHGVQQLARTRQVRLGHMPIAHQHRQAHVLQRGEGGQQVMKLKHEAQHIAPQSREFVVGQVLNGLTAQEVLAGGGPLQQAQHIQQGAFA